MWIENEATAVEEMVKEFRMNLLVELVVSHLSGVIWHNDTSEDPVLMFQILTQEDVNDERVIGWCYQDKGMKEGSTTY